MSLCIDILLAVKVNFLTFASMKRLLPIAFALFFMIVSCNRYAKYEAMLYPIESISASRPDSALRLYEALAPQMEGAPVRVKMYYDMMITKNMVNSGAQFTSDSMIRAVADFYDSHGEDSHRMLSRCLLGCVNLRMGNTPEALFNLESAAGCADTTAADCDYHLLGLVYALLAHTYLEAMLPRNVLEASRLCYRYAMKAGDTLVALSGFDYMANAYISLGMPDSAIAITEKSSRRFRESGYSEASAISTAKLIEIYIDRDEPEKASRCMAVFDRYSRVLDKNGDASPEYQGIYYVKGIYSIYTGRPDSAVYWLGKLQRADSLPLTLRQALADGLWRMYDKMGETDSVIKYAKISNGLMGDITTDLMKKSCSSVQAQYERGRLRTEVAGKTIEAERAKTTALAVALVLLAVVSVSVLVIRKRRAESRLREERHRRDLDTLERAQRELQQLLTLTVEERDALAAEKREAIERLQAMETMQRHADEATVEERLSAAPAARRFRQIATTPTDSPTAGEWQALRSMINSEIPGFYSTLNNGHVLRPDEYDVCILLRLHFKPLEISNLTGISQKNVSAMRRRMLQKVTGRDGKPHDFDDFILSIVK